MLKTRDEQTVRQGKCCHADKSAMSKHNTSSKSEVRRDISSPQSVADTMNLRGQQHSVAKRQRFAWPHGEKKERNVSNSTSKVSYKDFSSSNTHPLHHHRPRDPKNIFSFSATKSQNNNDSPEILGNGDALNYETRFGAKGKHLLAKDYYNALLQESDASIWTAFKETCERVPNAIAICGGNFSGKGRSSDTVSYTWLQFREKVEILACGLARIGFKEGDGAVICARSSIPLMCMNMAVLLCGGVVCHIHPNWNAEEICEAIVPCSNATLFVLDALNTNFLWALQHLSSPKDPSPNNVSSPLAQSATASVSLRGIILLNEEASCRDTLMCNVLTQVFHFGEFYDFGKHPSVDDATLSGKSKTQKEAYLFSKARDPRQCCLISFAYDVEGKIQGCCLSQDNILFTATVLAKCFGPLTAADRLISYLPLHHVAAQVLELFLPIISGMSVICAPSFEDQLLVNVITNHKPTIFFANPDTWAHISTQVYKAKGEANSILYRWAKQRATNNSNKLRFGKRGNKRLRSIGYLVAKTFVLNNIKKKIGLQSCQACYSVLAPLNLELESLFKTIDVPIYQLHGLAETSGFGSINYPHAWVFGSSGRALDDTQVHYSELTREVFYKGRNVFLGYVKPEGVLDEQRVWHVNQNRDPRDMGTRIYSSLDEDGLYRSPEYGHLTPDGFLMITGAPKDYIVLSTGDWVPIKPFERALAQQPELDRAVLVGTNRPYMSVLLFIKMATSRLDTKYKLPKHRAGQRPASFSISITPPRGGSAVSTRSQGNPSFSGFPGNNAANPMARVATTYFNNSNARLRRELGEDVLRLGTQIGSTARTIGDLMKCPFWAVHFDHVLEELPSKCRISNFRLRKWIIMPEPFSAATGELDSLTGHLRRRYVDEKYRSLLDSMYS